MKTNYRKGGIGAVMDEYERAATELINLVENISDNDFVKIIDTETNDEDCRSVQTIVSHITNSGFGYANYIRDWFSIQKNSPERKLLSRDEFLVRFNQMLVYTSETLEGRWEYADDDIQKISMEVRWGPKYDLEQLLEHAVVHILRHRRQIEKFAANGKLMIQKKSSSFKTS